MSRSPALPWRSTRGEDRLLGVILAVLLVVFLPLAVLIPGVELPERAPDPKEEPDPQVARMLEDPEEPEPEPEPEPELEPEPEPETSEPEPETQQAPTPAEPEETVEEAREVARESGLVGMRDQLAELRSLAPAAEAELRDPTGRSEEGSRELPEGPDEEQLMADSGGPGEPGGASVEEGDMARRDTRDIAGSGESADAQPSEPEKRPMANIRETFERNKSALFSIYNRARRQNPLLEGEVVLALKIAPGGNVLDVEVAESTLGNEEVARKIAQRVALFNFGAMEVPERSVRFPVDFAPPG
ncbi:AgmX/PglI C-terminal domain-containing protein [Vreelandella utahensis]|uniref:AgmX/PglI C-terminal domain-containing protein n=1 Tax=Vreelandella halophila TaxID=86177 RepID=UPI000986E7EF|nr:AgmX/PglI C-terminal domain-containing protein [Halomonas utahensis]